MTKKTLIETLAKICHYAQDHIDDSDAWNITYSNRENLLQCTSYTVACFLSQNTQKGKEGVEWSVVIDELVEHPMKSIDEWKTIFKVIVKDLQ